MQKILVIRGGALGDFILTLPVIQTLKQNYPGAEVELIGHLPFLLLGKNYISRAHSLIHPRWSSLYLDTPLKQPLVEHLALFDMIISYIGDSTSIF
ncbi:MAG TPA: hypothetical protein EYP78_03685 [Candidatus Omnitrophica bacterium]|nr:hypothetical protein [Candidatus Omnitrophota bacterium]